MKRIEKRFFDSSQRLRRDGAIVGDPDDLNIGFGDSRFGGSETKSLQALFDKFIRTGTGNEQHSSMIMFEESCHRFISGGDVI